MASKRAQRRRSCEGKARYDEAGWKVIRFASQELTKNVDKCVEQATRMIRAALEG